MKTRFIATLCLAVLSVFASAVQAQEYVTIDMEIDVDAPAEEVWAQIGGYCDIGEWASLPCEIASGDGGVGTVRSLFGGVIVEVLVGQTELSYGYTIPPSGDGFYDLYHGFLEARPVTDSTSKIVYTLMLDVSNLEGEEKENAVSSRRTQFEGLLVNMKNMVEGN